VEREVWRGGRERCGEELERERERGGEEEGWRERGGEEDSMRCYKV
jgi:hypothetical protein